MSRAEQGRGLLFQLTVEFYFSGDLSQFGRRSGSGMETRQRQWVGEAATWKQRATGGTRQVGQAEQLFRPETFTFPQLVRSLRKS